MLNNKIINIKVIKCSNIIRFWNGCWFRWFRCREAYIFIAFCFLFLSHQINLSLNLGHFSLFFLSIFQEILILVNMPCLSSELLHYFIKIQIFLLFFIYNKLLLMALVRFLKVWKGLAILMIGTMMNMMGIRNKLMFSELMLGL